LRRDVGIWVGLLATLHTIVGLTVHLRGRMWMYFLKTQHPPRIQMSLFGFSNYIGAVATIVFIVLLVISNDLSIRKLGTSRWKSISALELRCGRVNRHSWIRLPVRRKKASWVDTLADWLSGGGFGYSGSRFRHYSPESEGFTRKMSQTGRRQVVRLPATKCSSKK
jgi:hypothetical protein